MAVELIKQRLELYKPVSHLEETNALKECLQEIALFALSRSDFFKKASFMGGTALRIVYGLPRFSEGLDFAAMSAFPDFRWESYLKEISDEFAAYGLPTIIKDRSELGTNVKRAFLKQSSFGKILSLKFPRNKSDATVVNIRFEIDVDPPQFMASEPKLVRFPIPHSVICHALPSLFAEKLSALMTRRFVKGRDWFDLLWCLQHRVKPNLSHLRSALSQFGFDLPNGEIMASWVVNHLEHKISTINWKSAQEDVAFLLRNKDRFTLDLWDQNFFSSQIVTMLEANDP